MLGNEEPRSYCRSNRSREWDRRTPISGDTFSAVRKVAEAEGFNFREVQRQLRESKLKSQGTGVAAEIEVPTGWREDCALFAVNYLAVEYYAAKWLWSGRVIWDPVFSRIPRPGFYEVGAAEIS